MKKIIIAGWLLIGSIVSSANYGNLACELRINNDIEAATKIVESKGFDLNEAAFKVIRYTSKDVTLKFLLDHGLDVNAENEAGKSLLCALIEESIPCLYQVKLLISRGANIDSCGTASQTPLIIKAIRHGHLAIVGILLQQGIDVNMVHGAAGNSLLMHAAKANACSITALLLRKGANLLTVNKRYQTALMIADEHNYKFASRVLRNYHARFETSLIHKYYSFSDLFSHLYFEYQASPDSWNKVKNLKTEFDAEKQLSYSDCRVQEGDNCWLLTLWHTAKRVALYEASQSGEKIDIDAIFNEKQFQDLCKQAHEMQSRYISAKSKKNVDLKGSIESKIGGANFWQMEHFIEKSSFISRYLIDGSTGRFKECVLNVSCRGSGFDSFNQSIDKGPASTIKYMMEFNENRHCTINKNLYHKIYEFCKSKDKHLCIILSLNTKDKDGKCDHAVGVGISWDNGELTFEVDDSGLMYICNDEKFEATFKNLNELILKTRLLLFNEAFPKKLTADMRFRELGQHLVIMKNLWAKEAQMGLV